MFLNEDVCCFKILTLHLSSLLGDEISVPFVPDFSDTTLPISSFMSPASYQSLQRTKLHLKDIYVAFQSGELTGDIRPFVNTRDAFPSGITFGSSFQCLDGGVVHWRPKHGLWHVDLQIHFISQNDDILQTDQNNICVFNQHHLDEMNANLTPPTTTTISNLTKQGLWRNVTWPSQCYYLPCNSNKIVIPESFRQAPHSIQVAQTLLQLLSSADKQIYPRTIALCCLKDGEATNRFINELTLSNTQTILDIDLIALSRPKENDLSSPLASRLLDVLLDVCHIPNIFVILRRPNQWRSIDFEHNDKNEYNSVKKQQHTNDILNVLETVLKENSFIRYLFLFDSRGIPPEFEYLIQLQLTIPSIQLSEMYPMDTTHNKTLSSNDSFTAGVICESEYESLCRDHIMMSVNEWLDHPIIEDKPILPDLSTPQSSINISSMLQDTIECCIHKRQNLSHIIPFETCIQQFDKISQERIQHFIKETRHSTLSQTHPRLLIYGPPGSGKSLLCRSFETLPRLTVFPVIISQMISAAVGVSQKYLLQLFENAYAQRPSIIILEDVETILSQGIEDNTWGEEIGSYFCSLADQVPTIREGTPAVSIIVTSKTANPMYQLPKILTSRFSEYVELHLNEDN